MIVLGLDPGTRYCGVALLQPQPEILLHSEVIHITGNDSPGERIVQVCERVHALAKEYPPDLVAIEDMIPRTAAGEWQGHTQLGWINKLIGALLYMTSTLRPKPAWYLARPGQWQIQLTGFRPREKNNKMAVVHAVHHRLGILPGWKLAHNVGHHFEDAAGLALVAGDTWKTEGRLYARL